MNDAFIGFRAKSGALRPTRINADQPMALACRPYPLRRNRRKAFLADRFLCRKEQPEGRQFEGKLAGDNRIVARDAGSGGKTSSPGKSGRSTIGGQATEPAALSGWRIDFAGIAGQVSRQSLTASPRFRRGRRLPNQFPISSQSEGLPG